jgi:sensor histidine kinase YesM
MKRNIIVKICEWFFITVASLMATMAGIVGDYFVMVWIIFGIIVVSANTCLEKLIDERDEVIIGQEKVIDELTELYNTLVENYNKLEEENKALLNEMDNQSLSDSKQENTENK